MGRSDLQATLWIIIIDSRLSAAFTGQFSDLKIIYGPRGEVGNAHKIVVLTHSPVLARMFNESKVR
jgi:hypothetical protein